MQNSIFLVFSNYTIIRSLPKFRILSLIVLRSMHADETKQKILLVHNITSEKMIKNSDSKQQGAGKLMG